MKDLKKPRVKQAPKATQAPAQAAKGGAKTSGKHIKLGSKRP